MERDLGFKKTIIYTLSTIIISGISLFVITKKTSHGLEAIKYVSIKKRYLIFSLISLFSFHLFDALRLKEISKAFNVSYSFYYGFLTSLANTLGATITPFHIGGELVTFYMLGRKKVNLHKISSIVTIKAITGTISFTILFPFAVYYLGLPKISKAGLLTTLAIAVLLMAFTGVLIWVVNRNPKIKEWFKKYIIMLLLFKRRGKINFFLSIIYSVMIYISFLSIAPFIVWALGGEGTFKELFLKQLFLFYGIFLSPTPGGSGVGEIGAVIVYENVLKGKELLAFAILWRIMSQYLSAFIGSLVIIALHIIDLKSKPIKVYQGHRH
ncbi:MAG: lysylphosphatidylglycerol synthase transmembrane domain-containing protein [Thermosulfidibacteraceae bacterium]|jgi:uncharacterized membrane protein YbhN (UPF0104 family)